MNIKKLIQLINEIKSDEQKKHQISFNLNLTGRDDWDKYLKDNENQFTSKIEYMTPDTFLNRVRYQNFIIDQNKINKFFNLFLNKKVKIPTPSMWFMDEFQYKKGHSPSFHDGTHRVLALKQLGFHKIPVKIIF